jgi:hypothetical protein
MPFDKARLIETLKKELDRQGQIAASGAMCTYETWPDATTLGVDGPVDLDALAQAIIDDAMPEPPREWKPSQTGWYCSNCPGSSFTKEWIDEKKPCPNCNKMGGYAYHIVLN